MDELLATDVAWSAGLFDGEGCVGAYRQSDGMLRITVQVAMCDKEPIDRLQQIWGSGTVHHVSRGSGKPKVWVWNITTGQAARILGGMLPYLVNKKPQALVALEFQKTVSEKGQRGHNGDGRRLSPEVLQKREELAAQLKKLKKRLDEEVPCG